MKLSCSFIDSSDKLLHPHVCCEPCRQKTVQLSARTGTSLALAALAQKCDLCGMVGSSMAIDYLSV